jgi:hypothetical protein
MNNSPFRFRLFINMMGGVPGLLGALLSIALPLVAIAGWVTHVVTCFKLGLWGFLVAGALFFPIGIVHGVGHWFGAW